MGYKNDQFYNLPQEEYRIRMGDGSTRTNRAFGYPDNKVRTYTRDGNRLVPVNTTLKRGYIRSLQDAYQSGPTTKTTLPILRCDFQFNPATLQQAVEMRQDILNMFQQDPVQVTQPLAGQASFGFQLFFDRTFTYNNERDVNSAPEEGGGYDIANIGVLHDVRLLYSIIGQGINEDMITVALNSARNTLAAEAASATNEASDPSSTDTTTGATDVGVGIPDNFNDLANSFFNANFGNTAFLIPLPVRVVFSSLYMVDGYVTSSSIIFTKFSTSYVPLQCMVTLNMQAMYLGFAKKDTFLTLNLDEARQQIDQDIATNKQAIEDSKKALENYSPQINVKALSSNAPDAGNNKVNNKIAMLASDEVEKTKRRIELRIPNNVSAPLSSLFESNPTSINVELRAFVETYSVRNDEEAVSLIESLKSGSTSIPSTATHISTLTTTHSISNLEEWKNVTTKNLVKDATYYPHNVLNKNNLQTQYNFTTPVYVVIFKNYMDVKVASSERFEYIFDQKYTYGKLSTDLKVIQSSITNGSSGG